jgi:hypothetical protein
VLVGGIAGAAIVAVAATLVVALVRRRRACPPRSRGVTERDAHR